MSRSKVKVTGETPKKCGILFGSHPMGRGPRAALLSGAVLGGAVFWGRDLRAVYVW